MLPRAHQRHPRQLLLHKKIVSGRKHLRPRQATGRDIDVLRAFHRFIRQRRSARRAERPVRLRLRPIARGRAAREFETDLGHRDPRHRLRAGRLPAILAMTVAGEFDRPPRPVPHLAAITTPGNEGRLHAPVCTTSPAPLTSRHAFQRRPRNANPRRDTSTTGIAPYNVWTAAKDAFISSVTVVLKRQRRMS